MELGEEKAYLIEARLSRFLDERGLESYQQLYYSATGGDQMLTERIIDAMTTNETLWFRDKMPWMYMEEHLMEKYVAELRAGKRKCVRIWSAAASSGQEAYSTAMMIDRYLEVNRIRDVSLSQFEIVATDISQTVLDTAVKASYDAMSILRGLDDHYRAKYFVQNDVVYQLDDRIKRAVTFRKFNLQGSFATLGSFDVIFLRYVMIYFSDRIKQEITQKLQSSLRTDGVLFLGSSELHRCISGSFATNYFDKGMYYTKMSAACAPM